MDANTKPIHRKWNHYFSKIICRKDYSMLKRSCLSLVGAMFLTVPAWPQQKSIDLTAQSIEDLMNIEVTSVSKKGEKLSRTAAAIFVITQEDIRRSGATSILDVL